MLLKGTYLFNTIFLMMENEKIVEIKIKIHEICWKMKLSITKLVANLSIYRYEYEENTWYLLSHLSIQKHRTSSIVNILPQNFSDRKLKLTDSDYIEGTSTGR